jgi:hypothetical protein
VEQAWAEADEQMLDQLSTKQRSSLTQILSRLKNEPAKRPSTVE